MSEPLETTLNHALATLSAGGIVCLRRSDSFMLLATEASAVRRIRGLQDAGRFGAAWAIVATPEVYDDVAEPRDAEEAAAIPIILTMMPLQMKGPQNPASRMLPSLDPYVRAQVLDVERVSTFRPATAAPREVPGLARLVELAYAQGRLVLFASELGTYATDIATLGEVSTQLHLDLQIDCDTPTVEGSAP